MMNKIKMLALVVMLSLAGTAMADVVYFWGNASGDWSNPATWSGGTTLPSPTSVNQDIAITIGGVTINVTTDGQGAIDLMHGYHVGNDILNVVADKHLQITNVAQIGCGNDTDSTATGTLNVYGSFYSGQLRVGDNKYTTGIVNVYEGGSLDIGAWGLTVGKIGAIGTGTINIRGGNVTIANGSGLFVNPMGHIDIQKGTLSVYDPDGSQQYYIEQYIYDGLITGYGGDVELTVDFNSATNSVDVTAPGGIATNPNPANEAEGVLTDAVLSWTGDPVASGHDVYLGTNAASVANATQASPEFKGTSSTTSYTNPGGFDEGQTYYWRVDEVNSPSVWKGDVWSFTVISFPATNPSPADEQRKVALDTVLSWTGSYAAVQHDVYLGTDATIVANATQASPEFKGRQTAINYTYPGGFTAGQAYYWRIDEIDSFSNMVKGDVWKFATERTEPILLTKGIVLDRQFSTLPILPSEEHVRIDAYDVAVIKHMGFSFAKVMINPAPMISGSTINTTNMAYVDELVNRFLDQGVPVVVCIHPEPAFKTTYLGSAGGFTTLLSFYHDFAGYLAARWGQNEVVFQLMTEPFGNYTDWNTMLPQMVSSVRSAMPNNTLIIGGADSGRIAGLLAVNPSLINDNNVYYGFTYWDESGLLPFLFQGGGLGAYYPYLKGVPYPSSTSNNPADYILSTCPSGSYAAALAAVSAYCNTPWDMAKQQSVLQPIVNWNNANGGNLKLICYEMGVPIDPCQATAGGGVNPSDRIQYIHDKRLALEEKNIGWAYWSYNETFTVLNYPLRVAFQKGVTKSQVSSATLVALGLPCGCGCIDDNFPAGDINSDCYVNFADFAVLAGSWLDCTEPTDAKCLQ